MDFCNWNQNPLVASLLRKYAIAANLSQTSFQIGSIYGDNNRSCYNYCLKLQLSLQTFYLLFYAGYFHS